MPQDNVDKKHRMGTPFGGPTKLMLHLDNLNNYVQNDSAHPVCMEVNLTTRCNLRCKWCISENMKQDYEEIKPFIIDMVFKEYKALGGKSIIFSGGGEPTQHSFFGFIVREAKRAGLDLGLMTNGIYPNKYNEIIDECFKWIRFSVDTFIPEHYKKWKGAELSGVLIENILALKTSQCRTWLNANICEDSTIEDIESLIRCQKNVSGGVQFRPVLPRYYKKEKAIINWGAWNYLKQNYSDDPKIVFSFDKLDNLTMNRKFNFKNCDGHFFVPVLNANGDVCVCMYHTQDERFTFGNVYKKNFKNIWESAQRRRVIDFVRRLDYDDNCQVCCKLMVINEFLDFLKYAERPMDINFI